MENVCEILWITAAERMQPHESASQGALGFICYPAAALYGAAIACYPCCFLSHTASIWFRCGWHPRWDAHLAQEKHNLLVFISAPIGSQVRVTSMITGWFQQVVFVLSHQPLSWQHGGRIVGGLPGSDATFVTRGHPLISLHLPNKRLTSFLLATHIFASQKWMVHFLYFRYWNREERWNRTSGAAAHRPPHFCVNLNFFFF